MHAHRRMHALCGPLQQVGPIQEQMEFTGASTRSAAALVSCHAAALLNGLSGRSRPVHPQHQNPHIMAHILVLLGWGGFLHVGRSAPRHAWSARFQRDESGTTGALPRLSQSRHEPQPVRRLTLTIHHRLFIQCPCRIISMPGPALTGRHA